MKYALAVCLLVTGCGREPVMRETGVVSLPVGTIVLHTPLVVPDGAHGLEIRGTETTVLELAGDFQGRAAIVSKSGSHIRFHGFTIAGGREKLEQRQALPGYDVPFARFTANNGILIEQGADITISDVSFREVAGFSILVNGSKGVRIERVRIRDSGSRNAAGRNNTTGGILLEEGTSDFHVMNCELGDIRGNGIWTHSLYTSPRNADGLIRGNKFVNIGRDAIQVGHATRVRVEANSGERIGYPEADVDVENRAVPVAIDTAGNTDRSLYIRNRFTEINGKCIDLDGFHHGEVRENVCSKLRNFGVVMNNTNPNMQSEGVVIEGNTIDGATLGGIFVIGSGNRVVGNRLLNLNTSRCTDCFYRADEPDMLRSGIYLGRGAERPAVARGNIIAENEIEGFRMKTRCVGLAPGVSRSANTVERNRCSDGPSK